MSDQIPYVEYGCYVAYNNEKGGLIERLKEDGVVDLDNEFYSVPEWISLKAMINSWLADALMYELWVGSDSGTAQKIYCSDLPWPIGKALFFKQVHIVKQRLGITKDNAEQMEEEVPILLLLFFCVIDPLLYIYIFFVFPFCLHIPIYFFCLRTCFYVRFLTVDWHTQKTHVSTCFPFVTLAMVLLQLTDNLFMGRSTGEQTLHMELCQLGLESKPFYLKTGASSEYEVMNTCFF